MCSEDDCGEEEGGEEEGSLTPSPERVDVDSADDLDGIMVT